MKYKISDNFTMYLGFGIGEHQFRIKPGTISSPDQSGQLVYFNIFCEYTKDVENAELFRYSWDNSAMKFERTKVSLNILPEPLLLAAVPLSKKLDFAGCQQGYLQEFLDAAGAFPANIQIFFTEEDEVIKRTKKGTATTLFYEATAVPGLFDFYEENRYGEDSAHKLQWVTIAEIQKWRLDGDTVILPVKSNYIEGI